ncbi:hypothetical protein RESH_05313 [Rhodopirellula europaea SH398]|uniref:Uncharacterized protein n=1 Tax=Rhodopirellula europaea SH398 TaxID=1263868 RepID=M5S8W3_9BACT|nr:hypothetical protein RESH_05313 [Rhodopirellula europaea SH398]
MQKKTSVRYTSNTDETHSVKFLTALPALRKDVNPVQAGFALIEDERSTLFDSRCPKRER